MIELEFVFTGGLIILLLLLLIYSDRNRRNLLLKVSNKEQELNMLLAKMRETGNAAEVAENKVNFYLRQAAEKNVQLEEERKNVLSLTGKLYGLEAEHQNLQQKLGENKKELQEVRDYFLREFRILANDIFEEKSRKFTDQNKVNLSEILNPLRERIVEFEKKVENGNKETLSWNVALKEQINGLKALNQQLGKEAENLTRALKGDNKTQGNWGEYLVQPSFTENGRRFQPDILIRLPENKSIIIDSKVSLLSYDRYCAAEEDSERSSAIKAHVLSLRNHCKNLGGKNYQQIYQLKSLDFVLLFVPVEPAFSLAVQQDAQLFNDAFDQNIVIVSPSTLLATLRTVASIWKQENQNRNALEIARQGGELYDKFSRFVDDFQSIGKGIGQLEGSYQEAMKKLVNGRGNLVARAEKIKMLGAATTKHLPADFIEKATEGQEE